MPRLPGLRRIAMDTNGKGRGYPYLIPYFTVACPACRHLLVWQSYPGNPQAGHYSCRVCDGL